MKLFWAFDFCVFRNSDNTPCLVQEVQYSKTTGTLLARLHNGKVLAFEPRTLNLHFDANDHVPLSYGMQQLFLKAVTTFVTENCPQELPGYTREDSCQTIP